MKMNVLHINQSDKGGGAGIAGYRLHQSLLAQDINSHILVGYGRKQTSSNLVTSLPKSTRLEEFLYRLDHRFGLHYIHHLNTFDIPKSELYKSADILNFNNLHNGYFNYLAIPKLTVCKPAIYTLHDMWSFTGHCAYSYDCTKWKNGCGQCPYLTTYPPIVYDNTALEWKLKKWVYKHSNLTIVTPSGWLTNLAKQSLLKHFPIHHIPYGIDTSAYQPLESDQCRHLLGIPLDKNVLMFSADGFSDNRKGGDLLCEALMNLPALLKAKIVLLTMGGDGEHIANTIGITTLNLGYISSDRLKSIAYSAADLLLFPTRADNLPLTIQESMACGTPIVGCDVGGVPDLVRPGETGYLAAPGDVEDFRQGILQLIEDQSLRKNMANKCREIALKEYSLEIQATRYIQLYQDTLKSL